jgi:D-lyxose ketol-isomerase
MKRSEINLLLREATLKFQETGWALPPHPRWDVTDFGLGDYKKFGLVLINLADEPEYCEKLMFAKRGMVTPAHCHKIKKEDIICRSGRLKVRIWSSHPDTAKGGVTLKFNGMPSMIMDGTDVFLRPGERLTILPGVYHLFEPASDHCVIGEVSTANDDLNDNFFVDENIGRFPGIEEDVAPLVKLISDK